MVRELVTFILVCFLILEVRTQYNNPVFGEMPQGFQYNPYKMPDPFQQYPNEEYNNNKWTEQEGINYEEYSDYPEGTCSCEDCNNLKQYCLSMCPNCAPSPSPLSAPSYYYVQFPYQYSVVSEETSPPITSTKTTDTTVITTTTTTERTTIKLTTVKMATEPTTEITTESQTDTILPDVTNDSKVPDIITNTFRVRDNSPYTSTSLRRTKPNWMSKYGIVPISGQFAEKLMLQLRSMKVLHPRKDNLREIYDIKSVN